VEQGYVPRRKINNINNLLFFKRTKIIYGKEKKARLCGYKVVKKLPVCVLKIKVRKSNIPKNLR